MGPNSKQQEHKYNQAYHELENPVVVIPRDQYEAIKHTHPFSAAVAGVQALMSAGGIDYRRPVSSWVDKAGNLCHKNFFDGRYPGRLQATFPPRGGVV